MPRSIIDMHDPIPVEGRRIVMPGGKDVAVQFDSVSQKLTFHMARYYDNVDLSQQSCLVKYRNAEREYGSSTVTIETLGIDKIAVKWVVGPHVTQGTGEVAFQIEFFNATSGDPTYVWQTAISSFRALESLGPPQDFPPIEGDLLRELISRLDEMEKTIDVSGYDFSVTNQTLLFDVKHGNRARYSVSFRLRSTLNGVAHPLIIRRDSIGLGPLADSVEVSIVGATDDNPNPGVDRTAPIIHFNVDLTKPIPREGVIGNVRMFLPDENNERVTEYWVNIPWRVLPRDARHLNIVAGDIEESTEPDPSPNDIALFTARYLFSVGAQAGDMFTNTTDKVVNFFHKPTQWGIVDTLIPVEPGESVRLTEFDQYGDFYTFLTANAELYVPTPSVDTSARIFLIPAGLGSQVDRQQQWVIDNGIRTGDIVINPRQASQFTIPPANIEVPDWPHTVWDSFGIWEVEVRPESGTIIIPPAIEVDYRVSIRGRQNLGNLRDGRGQTIHLIPKDVVDGLPGAIATWLRGSRMRPDDVVINPHDVDFVMRDVEPHPDTIWKPGDVWTVELIDQYGTHPGLRGRVYLGNLHGSGGGGVQIHNFIPGAGSELPVITDLEHLEIRREEDWQEMVTSGEINPDVAYLLPVNE